MTQRTRYFLIGSALVVVVGLGTGLVAYYSGAIPLRASAIGPAELAYVPEGVAAVAYANVRSIMDSPFSQKLRETLPTGSQKDRLMAETGIDVQHDIDTVVAGLAPAHVPPVVLVRGRFDEAHIRALATGHGATATEYHGTRLLVGPATPGPAGAQTGPNDADHTFGIAFLEPGLVALGTAAGVQQAVDTALNHDDVTANHDLMTAVAGVQGTGNAWIVGRLDAMQDQTALPAQVRQELPNIQWFAFSAQIDQDVNGLVRAEARDDQAGEQLRSVVNGALAAARMFGNQHADLTAALNSIQTSGAGRTVEVSFTVTPGMLELIRRHAPMLGRGGPPAAPPAPPAPAAPAPPSPSLQ